MTNFSLRQRAFQRGVSVATLVALLTSASPAYAASSWNPGLLVNTESFQVIDEGDSTTDVELRFGGTLNEKIFWDFETGRFEFTDDVHVTGNLTATGTIISDGAISTKANLTINSDQTAADAVLTFGQPSTNETLSFINSSTRFEFSDDVYVGSSLTVDGATTLNGATTIGDAVGDTVTANAGAWTFANDTTVALTGGVNGLNFDSNTLSIDATNNRIGVGTAAPTYEVDAVGSIHASAGLSSSGTLVWEGAASGASLWVSQFQGAGLTDCDLSTDKVIWDATNKRFACATDLNTGSTYTAGQGLSVASNVFRLTPSFSGTALEIMGTASGRIVHAQDELRSSGSLAVDAATYLNSTLTVGSTVSLADGSNARLTFTGDTDTGIGHVNSDELRLTAGGSVWQFSDTVFDSQTTRGPSIRMQGETATPTYAFVGDTDTGILGAQTADTIDFITNATKTAKIDTNGLSVRGISSGKTLYAAESLRSSGSLVWEGAASGASLWVSQFQGAGLTDCDLSTDKVIWDATNKRFACATDLNTGSTYTAGQGLTVASNVFSLTPSFSGTTIRATTYLGTSGALVVDGSASIKTNLTINSDNGGADAILTFGNDGGAETIRFNDTSNNFSFSDDLDVTGNVDATGTVSGDGNFTINEDNTAADAVLTFGSDGTTENVTFQNSRDRFEFSDDVKTTGYLSGSTLTVDGTVTFRGQAMNFPTNTGSSGSVLRTDGTGNLGWYASTGDGSGDVLSLHPEYPNAIYYQSGSSYIGQLAGSGGLNSGFENTYQWTSTKATAQDYWVSTRIRVPDNFLRWDPVKSLQLRYRTKTGTTSQNHITVKLLDTTGANVALTGGATLANTSFTTASITGPSSAGTYTPGGFITVLVKLAANSSGQANAGFLTVNWESRK
jgi:hypothetical protein